MKEFAPYRAYCDRRRAAHQFRRLHDTEILADGRARRDGETLVNFAGNDYLGLSRHPDVIARAEECLRAHGAGSTASRLITGNHPLHGALEKKLAAGKGSEAALVMNGGYQTNLTVLAALADAEVVGAPVVVLADRLSHHSLLQGAVLGGARLMRFQHNDCDHLESLLRAQKDKDDRTHIIIVSESVFGMDGDRADLDALGALAKKYQALLYIDEAHATGLYGPGGFGLCAGRADIDVAMGTFGKALGSFGAYIACSEILRDYLIQRCGGLIYSTALPPSVLAANLAALDLLPKLGAERAFVQKQAARLREALRAQGWDCGASTTQIIPVILGGEDEATELAAQLKRVGFLVPAIRPPTVPRGTSRLRLSLSAAHKEEDIERLITVMGEAVPHFLQKSALAS